MHTSILSSINMLLLHLSSSPKTSGVVHGHHLYHNNIPTRPLCFPISSQSCFSLVAGTGLEVSSLYPQPSYHVVHITTHSVPSHTIPYPSSAPPTHPITYLLIHSSTSNPTLLFAFSQFSFSFSNTFSSSPLFDPSHPLTFTFEPRRGDDDDESFDLVLTITAR